MNFLRRIFACLMAALVLTHGPVQAGIYEDFFGFLLRNDAAGVARLVQRGFDPNTTGPTGMIALHMAIMERSYSVAETLINTPATKIDRRNLNDETALMLAALRGHEDLCRLLIKKGADVNKPGWTPLHYAASGEYINIVRLLLDENAYIDAEAPSGNTPLMMAALYGSEDTMAMLLEAGADPTLKNNAGRSAMDLAVGINRAGAVKLLTAGIAVWNEKTAAEAKRMKFVEEQVALQEAADLVEEATDGAKQALANLVAQAAEGAKLQAKLNAPLNQEKQSSIQITDLPPVAVPSVPLRPLGAPTSPAIAAPISK